jgi:hypothetical protein
MTTDLDPDLTAHTNRLLIGTDLTPTTAQALAEGTATGTGAVAVALRDGWAAARGGERS